MSSDNEYGPVKIEIKGLYKIFGPDAKSMVPLVRQGMQKQALLDRHSHVLQQSLRCAAKCPFPNPRMAISTHHNGVRLKVERPRQQSI